MPLSPEAIIKIRSWIGDEPVNAELQKLFAQVGTHDEVVLQVLRKRLANLTSEPASLSVPGLSVSNGQNMISLEALIKKFENSGGLGLDASSNLSVTTAKMTRATIR